jgi:hypothetical protein
MLNFVYDVSDVDRFKGLRRPWDQRSPYLTPVFFDKNVLVRYFYDPRYRTEFFSETFGQISDKNGDFAIRFGITPNSKVIFWLGDLAELPESEQSYLILENVPSDHNIESEFYDSQINLEFTRPILEVEILLLKAKINEISSSKFGINIFKEMAGKRSVDTIIRQASRYKRITFENEDDFKRFISEWNELLVEDINIDDIQKFLDGQGISYKEGIKGNKTLEKFIQQFLGVSDNIIASFFFLNDLRIWADHANADSRYDGVVAKLGLPADSSYEEVYKEMIKLLHGFLQTLLDKIM